MHIRFLLLSPFLSLFFCILSQLRTIHCALFPDFYKCGKYRDYETYGGMYSKSEKYNLSLASGRIEIRMSGNTKREIVVEQSLVGHWQRDHSGWEYGN